MAGGSHLVWLPLLLSGVFETSDSRHVPPEMNKTFISHAGSANVASFLGKIPITLPEGINPENIHFTSVNIASCTDMEEQIHSLNKQLQETTFRSSQQGEEAFGLRRDVRLLKMQLATCSSSASAVTGPYQNQLYHQMKLLLETVDSDAFLNLKVIALTREVTALQRRIELAANSTDTEIMVLHNDLQVKMKDLHAKKQQMERRLSNSELILQIISLQNQIWDLEVEELRRGETVLQQDSRIAALQKQLDMKLRELRQQGDASSVLLEIISVHSRIAVIQRLISDHIEKSRANYSDYQMQMKQKSDILTKKILRLNREESNTELTREILILQDEMEILRQMMSDAKTNPRLTGLRVILEQGKSQQEHLQKQLEETDFTQAQLIMKIIGMMREVREKQRDGQQQTTSTSQTTVLTLLRGEYAKAQADIKELQRLVQEKSEKCSGYEERYSQLKTEFDQKIAELNTTGDSTAANIVTITDLTNRLRKLQQEKESGGITTSAAVTELKKQLKIKEEEHFRDQVEITALQNELNHTTAQCSSFGKKIQELQTDLDEKLKKLQSESDSVTSLALQVSTITLQQEELKRQLQNTDSEAKIQELQKQIEEKNNKLAEKTEELKARSAQPQRFLHIISLQTKIAKLVNVAANNTDYSKIRALQNYLNDLIEGIRDENNENTQLLFKILTLQEEIARLKKQEKSQSEAQLKKIKDLENELEDIRSQIAEKTLLLVSSDLNFSNLSAQIMELHQKIKPLEDEISDLKQQHAENFSELQARLSLTKRQLQDSELRLKDADAKNFQSMMDIIDLRDQLTKAQKQASKAAGKNINELEQQLQTQQRENTKLENSNRDLKQTLKELKMSCDDQNTLCEERQTQLQVCQQDMDRLERQLQERDVLLKQLQQESEEQAGESNRLQQENQILENRLQQSQQKVEDLQQELPAKDAMLNRLQQELEEKATANNRLQDKYSNLENENNELAEKVQGLQNQLSDVDERRIYTRKGTFDPNTANPRIVLSADNTEMSTTEEIQNVQDHPGRFDVVLAILGETGFSSGRHYWEVSVAGKSCYHIGMASESAPRRGSITFSPTNGYWTIVKNKLGQYKAIDNRPVLLRGQTQLLTLGILLDYKKGQVSFYNAGARSHLYSFQSQSFTDKIHPFINFCIEDIERRTPIVLLTPGSTDWIK